MRKPTKRSLTRKLDKICSEIVRARGYCAKCNSNDVTKLETAHIYSRVYKNLRFDLSNLLCLCKSCHYFFHRNPLLFAEWVKIHLGELNYTQLKQQARAIKKWTIPDMLELYETLLKWKGEEK